ncbi:MAG: sugar phosphate nucleotidyltransferase [Gemmatimonadota bacterium]
MRFDAMILAAGLGRRLHPFTEDIPKALIDVAGRTMLGRIVGRLSIAGARQIVVNIHHHADQIRAYLDRLQAEDETLCPVVISHEVDFPLETGGGILRASSLFGGTDPIVIQNVDVISGLDLEGFVQVHMETGALATLAVSQRHSTRTLWFDDLGLWGRDKGRAGGIDTGGIGTGGIDTDGERVRNPVGDPHGAAFAGIHVVSPDLPRRLEAYSREIGNVAFSITDAYLWMAGRGDSIRPYDAADALWLEVGTPERLADARRTIGLLEAADQP